jgi:hypothetical protein
MSDKFLVQLQPFAVRPREGARLAGVGLTLFYKRLNDGTYQSFLDGNNRLVVTASILAHQQKQLKIQRGTPRNAPSVRGGGPGRPRKVVYNPSSGRKPGIILGFPSSRMTGAVRVERERDGLGWITLAGACGWIHGDRASALRDAYDIAAGLGLTVRSS